MSQMYQYNPSRRGLNAVLSINGEILGGQKNSKIVRESDSIEITNKINSNWKEYLTGPRSWYVECAGMFVKDEEAFNKMEEAFNQGLLVDICLSDDNKQYNGKGIIIKFPMTATYDSAFAYNITVKGSGPLE